MSETIDIAQLMADAAVGRALRAASTADSDEPLIHVCWVTPSGETRGRFLGDPRLTFERRVLADAAANLLESLTATVEPSTPIGQRMQCWCGWRGVLDQVAEHERTPGYHRAVMAP